ncbi:Rieske (2Fe-2S) protein [Actinomadura gamaensis]|uniref:Rieske (2Fe-2S) protein n=1 Tax=Actinomadura gamaensis TaxID=1763541 RepID=A0ABV9U809_9ACTN
MSDGLTRHVRDLLRGRRPRRFRPTEAEAEELRAAIELRAARPGADAPREEFVTQLHRKLAHAARGEEAPAPRSPVRRALLAGGALAVGGAAVGAVADHTLSGGVASAPPDGDLTPLHGVWHPVVAADALPEGGVQAFEAGGMPGFLTRRDGRFQAVSGICTHQGCELYHQGDGLRCPCHESLFALDGRVLRQHFKRPLAPLPRLAVRRNAGNVEVYVPNPPGRA